MNTDTNMTQDDPRIIFQDLLDAVSDAHSAQDINRLMSLINLPYLHQALDAKIMLETREDLLMGVDSFVEALKTKGVTQTIRLVSQASYLSPNYIDGVYVTHLLRDTRPIVRSYTNRAVIRRTRDGWKLTETFNGFKHSVWPIKVFYVPEAPPDYSADGQDDARRGALEPLAIYQTFINRMTQANVSGAFERYTALCAFPHWAHADRHDQEIKTPEDVRPFFESVLEMLDKNGVEEFMRIADHAEFISANEICGYHVATFLKDGMHVLPPVKSRMILRRVGTKWFMSSVTNSLSNDHYPYRHPVPSKDLVTQLELQKRTKTWPTLQ